MKKNIKKQSMNKSTTENHSTLKQSELLSTQSNAQEQENNSDLSTKLVDIRNIEGTPLTIVKKDDEGEFNCFIAIGKNRITGMMTEEECERLIEEKDWLLITNVIIYISGKVYEEHTQYEGEIKI